MVELALEGLVHVYPEGDVRALDGIDLRIGPGERVALVGQNGSGKTTLVRHLNGLLRPTEGSVSVGGVDAATRTVAQLASAVGLVFQDPDRQIFAGSVRYRAPWDFLLALLGAFAIVTLWEEARERRARRARQLPPAASSLR